MKKIIMLSVLLANMHTCAMDRQKTDAEIKKNENTMTIKPREVAEGLAAFALGCRISQINSYQNINVGSIQHLSYHTEKNCNYYLASLHNGDTVTANLFTDGPLTGKIRCNRNVITEDEGIVSVPLDKNVFSTLEKLYQDQAK